MKTKRQKKFPKLDEFTESYVECAIVSTNELFKENLFDSDYPIEESLTSECLNRMIKDCKEFQAKHKDYLFEDNQEDPFSILSKHCIAGNDFWLARNIRSLDFLAFWDYKELTHSFRKASEAFGPASLYTTDGVFIHHSK